MGKDQVSGFLLPADLKKRQGLRTESTVSSIKETETCLFPGNHPQLPFSLKTVSLKRPAETIPPPSFGLEDKKAKAMTSRPVPPAWCLCSTLKLDLRQHPDKTEYLYSPQKATKSEHLSEFLSAPTSPPNVLSSLYYWGYSPKECSNKNRTEWKEAFKSLYSLFRSKTCHFFYFLQVPSLTVLFHLDSSTGDSEVVLQLQPALLDKLRRRSLPFCTDPQERLARVRGLSSIHIIFDMLYSQPESQVQIQPELYALHPFVSGTLFRNKIQIYRSAGQEGLLLEGRLFPSTIGVFQREFGTAVALRYTISSSTRCLQYLPLVPDEFIKS